LNGTGAIAPGDPGLKSWTINLLNSSGVIVYTTTSAKNGTYSFHNVTAQPYVVEEILQSGWYETQPVNPPGTYTVPAQPGGNITGLNFGNFQTYSVTGSVYNDLNGNGMRSSGEPGLSGWTLDLINSGGIVVASATTDASGNYSFSGVGPGSWSVGQVVQTNWVQTQPFYPVNYSFTGKSGHNLSALVFGDFSAPALSPSSVIGNGQPGYAETGSWSTSLGGFNGTNRVATTSRSTKVTASASFTFNSLPAGSYQVWITYAGKSSYATAAPFTVYDGGTNLGTQTINESILVTQAQGGRAQGSFGGVGWLELGSFTISSGTLEVLLTNNSSSGKFIDANGVLIVPDSPPAVVVAPAGSASSNLSIGVVPAPSDGLTQPADSAKSGATAAPTISIKGVSQPSALHVVYNQGPAAPVGQPSTGLIDAALGAGTSNGKSLGADLIASLAKDRVSGKNGRA
jgi:hypothetical protein